MLEIVILGIIIWAVWYYMKETRLERQKQKFEKFSQECASREEDRRDGKVTEIQRANMNELASYVKPLLYKFQRDIPPRFFDDLENLVQSYVDEVKAQKLYSLYNVLLNSNVKNVYENLNKFRR
ncbi:hypothetical protein Gmet_2755 [Geobacter metallireducens GS-15]|uniref:Uncharacterized protein n=1 Tax=Geobacter metallireducens (strain ATCC 53774 / DSM 7210 / GS-15) TaxID=269799 RepID=Q39S01_GEOMG|nr:hypothetical protein [Geobacter metallireducens]ABB32973.1 hypothetical protein Gmet_2755 [Geobacter metallireducens GS-15]